jgi:hypothetical protein
VQPVEGFLFALATCFKVLTVQRSTLSDPNNVSLQALSQQLPLRLIEGVIPHSFSSLANS